jgi:hypothetical protein
LLACSGHLSNFFNLLLLGCPPNVKQRQIMPFKA